MSSPIPFLKGHGTQNDFVLVPDADAALGDRLDAATVRRITNRWSGIGADGLIRIVRSASIPEGRNLAGEAEWFMDYRNADGSLAEMCGNGVRVLGRYLWETGAVVGQTIDVGTRGGPRRLHLDADGTITVEMGHAVAMPTPQDTTAGAGGHTWPVTAVSVPNPHAVVFVDSLDEPGRLSTEPEITPPDAFPEGVNVEFVVAVAERHIAMRVWERGVGETRSCGTGVVAAAWASAHRGEQRKHRGSHSDGHSGGQGGPNGADPVIVDVPGGRLWVRTSDEGELLLSGPAVLGVGGTLQLPV